MLDKYIDPPCDVWEDKDLSWIDDLYEGYMSEKEEIDIALYNYECQVYNELDRRIRV